MHDFFIASSVAPVPQCFGASVKYLKTMKINTGYGYLRPWFPFANHHLPSFVIGAELADGARASKRIVGI